MDELDMQVERRKEIYRNELFVKVSFGSLVRGRVACIPPTWLHPLARQLSTATHDLEAKGKICAAMTSARSVCTAAQGHTLTTSPRHDQLEEEYG